MSLKNSIKKAIRDNTNYRATKILETNIEKDYYFKENGIGYMTIVIKIKRK